MKSKRLFVTICLIAMLFSACGVTGNPAGETVTGLPETPQTEKIPEITDTFSEIIEETPAATTAFTSVTETVYQTETSEEEQSEVISSDEIRPEFKEALDSYEAFFDEYCEFMKKYMESPDDLNLLMYYASYVSKYTEVMESMDKLGEVEMSDAELKYYIEVTNRINQKLLDVAF